MKVASSSDDTIAASSSRADPQINLSRGNVRFRPIAVIAKLAHTLAMLERLSVKGLAILIAGITIIAFGTVYLWIAGSAVVVDETGGVESAYVVTGDAREQQLSQLWSGYFYAIPQLEGTIRVRCRDGSTKEAGYVTGHMHTKIRMVGDTPCARVEEVI